MKILIINILILICVMFSISCNTSRSIEHKPSAEITYFKDNNTNLCFAQLGSMSADGYIIASITEVPCNTVEKFLLKDK